MKNLSWSKFASLPLRSKSRINKANKSISTPHENKNSKHIDVLQWLKSMDLQQYEDIFKKFDGVEDLLEFSEADLKDLGVKISSHRATLISNLTILRAKYHGNFRRQPSVRHSVAVDNKITVEEDDKLGCLQDTISAFIERVRRIWPLKTRFLKRKIFSRTRKNFQVKEQSARNA